MKLETFFDNFELLTDAPNSIVKLREIILQLAVRGKLVPQDSNDESASVLLEKIKTEKEALIQEKKVREDKKVSTNIKNEITYKLPHNWVLVCLGDILNVIRGASPRPKGDPKYFSLERTPYHWIKISDIRKYSQGIILTDTDEFLTKEGAEKSVILEKGTLILTNSATIGVPIVLGINGGCIHDGYLAFPYLNENYLNKKYLYYYFLHFQTELKKRAFGGAQLNLNTSIVKNAPFALPPIPEQKRIVEKCDRLLSICDEIEKRQQQRQESIVRMNESAIAQLLSSQNPDDFHQHWQRICNNFDLLYSIPETIPKLRQAILQLAVQGKLVRQDPNDEPGTSLLERIIKEKQYLTGKTFNKKGILEQEVTIGELPYKLPETWCWVQLDQVVLFMDSGWSPACHPNPTNGLDDWGVLKTTAVQALSYQWLDHKELPKGLKPRPEYEVKQGDILITRAGPKNRVGICCLVKETRPRLMISDKIIRFHLVEKLLCPEFVVLSLNSGFSQTHIEAQKSGMAESQMNISQAKLRSTPVPLPPLAEQKRIVEKCDRLMSLCDTLEAKLKQGRDSSEKLMEVAAKQVLTA
ncbi:MAG TPA: restriction endonuclease subunit S [Trichormus sp. M33_DOE_039]|nr:restriction endonuclease subunit S [Trichormus sp. M33_DOE_039]